MQSFFENSWMFTKTDLYLRFKQVKLIYGDDVIIVVILKSYSVFFFNTNLTGYLEFYLAALYYFLFM
jgi:hypothetical protein